MTCLLTPTPTSSSLLPHPKKPTSHQELAALRCQEVKSIMGIQILEERAPRTYDPGVYCVKVTVMSVGAFAIEFMSYQSINRHAYASTARNERSRPYTKLSELSEPIRPSIHPERHRYASLVALTGSSEAVKSACLVFMSVGKLRCS